MSPYERIFSRRPPLDPHVLEEPGVHDRGRGRAGPRDRRQHGHLLGRQRRAAETGAVPAVGSARRLPADVAAGRFQRRVAGQVPVLARADLRREGRRGLPVERRELHRRGPARAAPRRAGLVELLHAVRRADHARPRVHGRRGSTRRREGGAAQLRASGCGASAATSRFSAARCRSAAIPTPSSASSDPSSTWRSSGRRPRCGSRSSSIPTRPTRGTTSRRTAG